MLRIIRIDFDDIWQKWAIQKQLQLQLRACPYTANCAVFAHEMCEISK